MSIESAMAAKDLMAWLGGAGFMHSNFPLTSWSRAEFLLNRSIPEFENLDFLLLVGANPKYESPLLNTRILSAVKNKGLKVYKIGAPEDLGYHYYHLGNTSDTISEIIKENNPFNERLLKVKNGHVLFSAS